MTAATTFLAIAASIVFLTLTGGGLFPSTVGIVATVLGGLFCLIRLPTSPESRITNVTFPRPTLELLIAAILLFVLLTAIPIPPALDVLAGSLRHDQNQAVTGAFHAMAKIGAPAPDTDPWFALTRNRAGTLRFFLLLASAFGAFLLSATLPSRWRITQLYFLAFLGTIVGIAGWLGQWMVPQGDTLWWIIPVPHTVTSPVGCFLNRNHFGGFVAMLCPIALALAHHALQRRRWFVALLCLFLTATMMMVVFQSLSRGALLALCAGLMVTILIIAFRHRPFWGILILALLIAGGATIYLRSPAVQGRLAGIKNPAEITSVQSRIAEWRESLRVWPHYPALGAGMNALRMVYPQYRQTSVGGRLLFSENEYVQLLTEGGLLGLGLATAFLWTACRRLRTSRHQTPDVILISVASAITVTAIHCLFDFPAHLPLYALALGAVTGLLIPPQETITHTRFPWMWLPCLISVAGATVIGLRHPENLKTMDDPGYLYTAKYRDLQRALVWAPSSSSAWLYLGQALYREGATRHSQELCVQGESFITRAAELDPRNYRLWYELGQTRLAMKDYPRAREAFEHARQLRSWLTPPPIPEAP